MQYIQSQTRITTFIGILIIGSLLSQSKLLGQAFSGQCACSNACSSRVCAKQSAGCVCRSQSTCRWVEATAWDVQYEPACLAGCLLSAQAARNKCGAADCDAASGCDSACGGCASCDSNRFSLASLFHRDETTRVRKKLVRRTQQVQLPAVSFVAQQSAACSCQSCGCVPCAANDHPTMAYDPETGWLSDVASRLSAANATAEVEPTPQASTYRLVDVNSAAEGPWSETSESLPPIVAGTLTQLESSVKTNVHWTQPIDPNSERMNAAPAIPATEQRIESTAKQPKPVVWIK